MYIGRICFFGESIRITYVACNSKGRGLLPSHPTKHTDRLTFGTYVGEAVKCAGEWYDKTHTFSQRSSEGRIDGRNHITNS